MDFAFSEEQEELRRSVRRFLDDRLPMSEVRRLMGTPEGYDKDVWGQMAEQLGLQGIGVPEQHGGAGCGYVDLIVVFEEMGRSLACVPYFSTVALAANALIHSGDERAKADFLPGIASGETVATLAFTEEDGNWDIEALSGAGKDGAGDDGSSSPCLASPPGAERDAWTLQGAKSYVIDGNTANLIIVVARAPGGVSMFAVDCDAPGLVRAPLQTMDATRKQAELRFSGTPARLVGEEGGGLRVLEKVLQLAAVALAGEQVGGAQRCLDMSVEYAKSRVQFGRPIGSFQAIKHKCADVLLDVSSAKSAAYYAAWVAEEDSDELPVAASLVKSYCSDAYFHAAAENIQIHGGIGFTWEHDAHLYFKRAKSSELMLGDPSYHRELLVRRLGV